MFIKNSMIINLFNLKYICKITMFSPQFMQNILLSSKFNFTMTKKTRYLKKQTIENYENKL